MSTQIKVIAVPTVQFGKFKYAYKPCPTDDKASQLLAALKKQFNYKATVRGGKTLPERVTFDNEWLEFASNKFDIEFSITDVPHIEQLRVGDKLSFKKENTGIVDFSFL